MEANHIYAPSYRWKWVALIWFGFGLVDAIQTVFVMRAEGMHHAWVTLFLTSLFAWLPWLLVTPLVMHLGHRFPPARWRSLTSWLVHLAACGTIGLTSSAWAVWLILLFNPYAITSHQEPFLHLWSERCSNGVLAALVFYSAILTVSSALDSRARLARQQTETARLNEQLSKAQLDALRRQVEPHFLFNTLNSVSALVREQRNDAAVNMIAGLSDFLRRVLEDSPRQEVPLAEEMEFAQKYLDIQKVRFAERLQWSVDVPEDLLLAKVPTLILQLMVENAIKHGIAKRAHGGAIRIAALRSGTMLTLSIYNDGPSLPVSWDQSCETMSSGIGISNMRTRLQSLYGDAFDLNMQNQPPGGVEVSISVPFKE